MRSPHRLTGVVTLVGLLALTACSSETPSTAATTPPTAISPAAAITVAEAWVKTADSGMTAAYGVLTNSTDQELTVVSATSPVSTMELHEVVMDGGQMKMQPKTGGFVIPARGTHELKPGGDHLMLMNVATPVKAGDKVSFTLTLKDGSTVQFSAVAKPFAGGNESYDPGMQMSPSPSHG